MEGFKNVNTKKGTEEAEENPSFATGNEINNENENKKGFPIRRFFPMKGNGKNAEVLKSPPPARVFKQDPRINRGF